MASQILDRVGVSAAAADQAKVIIQRQVRHLSHLTDDLLDAGRVMMGKINLDRKPIDLADTVRGAVETLRNTGQLSQHELTVSLNPVWVEADATRIDQIVDNLLTNAVKYTPSPGAISVAVERDGANAVFRVCDSGLGLDPDLTPRIFDLFVQGERSLDRSQGGLGIGLTLVRRLAELHGGRVEAKSEGPGKGSEFIVRLPAIEDLDKPPASSTSSPAGEPRTIVIVDDNPDALISLRYLLELDGHQVHEASDGPSGVETILRECPDIALIDIGLPVLDGYAVAQTIRSRSERRVRLIAVTGYGNREDVNRGMLAGFDEYLVKPVDPSILGKLILEV
jgi:CheY-like chemotaxis protein/two-component sensor histidine kinase